MSLPMQVSAPAGEEQPLRTQGGLASRHARGLARPASSQAPLCLACQVEPVRARQAQTRPHQVAADGSCWRKYCSRTCSNIGTGAKSRIPKASRVYWDAYRARLIRGILASLEPESRVIDGEIYIRIKPLASWVLKEKRDSYMRGANMAYQRERRKKVAWVTK